VSTDPRQLKLELARHEVALQSRRRTLGGGGTSTRNLTDSVNHDKCNFPAGGVLENMERSEYLCMAATPPRQWRRRDHRAMVFVMCGCKSCIEALSVVDLARTRRSKRNDSKSKS